MQGAARRKGAVPQRRAGTAVHPDDAPLADSLYAILRSTGVEQALLPASVRELLHTLVKRGGAQPRVSCLRPCGWLAGSVELRDGGVLCLMDPTGGALDRLSSVAMRHTSQGKARLLAALEEHMQEARDKWATSGKRVKLLVRMGSCAQLPCLERLGIA